MYNIARYDVLAINKRYFGYRVEQEDAKSHSIEMADGLVQKTTVVDLVTKDVTEALNTRASDIHIIWFDVLPGGQMLLLCMGPIDGPRGKNHMRLYSANQELLCQLELTFALSATRLNDRQIMVTKHETDMLQMVNIDDENLTKGTVTNNPGLKIALIHKYSDTSVVVLATRGGDPSFEILDMTGTTKEQSDGTPMAQRRYDSIADEPSTAHDCVLSGKVEKHIKVTTELRFAMCLKISIDRKTVYVLDGMSGCFGFNLQGEVVFHYISADNDHYGGLAMDQRGALYFCARRNFPESACVVKLSPAGQMLQQIRSQGEIPLQCIGNKLYLSCLPCQNDRRESVIVCWHVDLDE